ncbi:hypothetical protein CJ030_MR5G011946 [Morella rubra]|uniref:Uncharacterized protein n=1 Tax=Morella rubra TaxID=262757 RepID=A0A6A1VGX7_9ROSI|nr:hypothetical protein CJ030_MR5G011946 [Morella rubra]
MPCLRTLKSTQQEQKTSQATRAKAVPFVAAAPGTVIDKQERHSIHWAKTPKELGLKSNAWDGLKGSSSPSFYKQRNQMIDSL